MNQKRVVGLFILSLVVLSFFAVVVSAQTLPPAPGTSTIESLLGRIVDALEKIIKKDLPAPKDPADTTFFPKILMFLLVSGILYAISGFLPFMGNNAGGRGREFLKVGISVIIGLLSIWFLSSEQIATILLSYKALGVVLTSVIPFIVVVTLTKQLHENGHGWLNRFIWIGMFVVIGYLWAAATDIGNFGRWTYGLVTFISFVMIFFERKWYRLAFRKKLQSQADSAVETVVSDQQNENLAELDKVLENYNRLYSTANSGQLKSLQNALVRVAAKNDKKVKFTSTGEPVIT